MSQLRIYRASAGSGKTFKLTGQYLSLLFKNPNNYRHILAVTFTNKATEEMKSRIVKELFTLAKGDESNYLGNLIKETNKNSQQVKKEAAEILNRLLHDYSRFSVGTIDSFFQSVIRAFTKEIGLQGGFTIEMDESGVLTEVVDKLISDIENDEELKKWLMRYAQEKVEEGKSWNLTYEISKLAKEIFKEEFKTFDKELIKKIQNKKFLDNFIQSLYAIQSAFEAHLQGTGKNAIEIIRQQGLTIDDFSNKDKGVAGYLLKLSERRNFEPGKRARDGCSDIGIWVTKNSLKKILIEKTVTQHLMALLNQAVDYYDSHFTQYNSADCVAGFLYTLGILTDIAKRVKDYTDENNLFLISDSSKLLREIISDTDAPFVYEKTGNIYKHFMIDEFQDTSGLQWANFRPLISNSLSENFISLVVGDVKQSIYRWRNGDWKLLAEQLEMDVSKFGSHTEPLNFNWRSKENVMNFNNSLFHYASIVLQYQLNNDIEKNATAQIAKLEDKILRAYIDSYQKLPDTNENKGGYVNATFIENTEDAPWREEVKKRLPACIEQLQDKGYSPKDIAILVRSKNDGQEIANVLLDYKNSTHASAKYTYDVISNEALFVCNSPAVRLLVHLLKYFINPGDSINKAFILHEYFCYIKNNDNLPPFNQALQDEDFKEMLPPEFSENFNDLKCLPLFELTEKLINLFFLNSKVSDIPYLQEFQEMVLNFVREKTSDIGSFLEWWNEKGIEQSIAVSEQQDAIKILTIHKSKGLEFKAVIVPFCNWRMDHDSRMSNILWCKPETDPFNQLELLPVKYSSKLAQTIFYKEYFTEKMKSYVDNLNLLYVAFTRAEEALQVFLPLPEKEGINNVADLIHYIFNQYTNFPARPDNQYLQEFVKDWDDNTHIYQLGKPGKKTGKEKKPVFEEIKLDEYPVHNIEDRLRLKKNSIHYFSDNGSVNYGAIIHALFEKIITADDMDMALQELVFEGKTGSDDIPYLKQRIKELFENKEIQDWFSGSWEVKAERTLLLKNGKSKRPDRVMTKNNKAIALDYKTGNPKPEDEAQIKEYISFLKEMGYENIEGRLLYFKTNQIIPV
ncbi:MAG: UvrD-helicase domain-containing protein [Bacteroidia bacterium]|nr:UvrD-helicase domain-containing protein [Bacteroidia bacterium]